MSLLARCRSLFSRPHLWLITLIGVIVPRRLRADWRQEWAAELQYREALLADWERLRWHTKLDLLRRSLSAFWDALWLQSYRWEDEMFQDFRYGVRMLFKQKSFTLVAVLTLALGIGATTALFSVVYAVLINPYPYAKPQEIWSPGLTSAKGNQPVRPYRLSAYLEMAQLPAFSDIMATNPGQVLLTGEFAPESVTGVRMTGNAFQFLGVPPVLGRTLQPSDIRPNGEPELVTVLSFKRWQRLFGGNPEVLGKTLRLNNEDYTIVGVMPPRFGWWTDDGLWLPLGTVDPDSQMVFPITRLKPGVSAAVAAEQMHPLQLEWAKAHPTDFPGDEFTTRFTNYLDVTVASGEMQQSLLLLFGAVGFLLLIACANVANLQLAKATARAREMAVRLALGAGRGQLVRQLLTESVLLSLLGGLLGLLFAYWITSLMVTLMPDYNVPNEARIEVNGRVLIFCIGVSALTGILFGLVPALQSSRPNLVDALKDEGRGSSAAAGGKTRAVLVVVEVALSVVLLVSASLTMRSFIALQNVDLGFQPEGVMGIYLPLPPKRYATADQRNRFAHDLLERASHLPGVVAATIGDGGLPFGGPQSRFVIEGQTETETQRVMLQAVSADYLRVMNIPLRQGRMLTDQEVDNAAHMAVINETAAKLWPAGDSPLGRRVRLDELGKPELPFRLTPVNPSPDVTVIGVVADMKNADIMNETQPAVIVPYTLLAPPGRSLAIRSQSDPQLLMNALREQVREMDSEQPLVGPYPFTEILNLRRAQPRFTMTLFGLFAALGLILAVTGIYSVLAYLVSRRTREIGVRMALGAQPFDILRLILRTGSRLVGIGIVIGLLASFVVTRLLGNQLSLFKVTAGDPISYLLVAILLGVVALLACLIPARRAMKIEPMVALRYD